MRPTHEVAWRKFIEPFRVTTGAMASDARFGHYGMFELPNPHSPGEPLKVLSSDGMGWEHVSVSLPTRCPTWEEMHHVKHLFWRNDEAAMELHPPESEYINNHPYCLHLWRPCDQTIPLPPSILVGHKSRNPSEAA
jgi:hypothetical protein